MTELDVWSPLVQLRMGIYQSWQRGDDGFDEDRSLGDVESETIKPGEAFKNV